MVPIIIPFYFYYTTKFTLSILILISIRAGVPRFRYDYLTKLGWLKFISISIITFISSYWTTLIK